MLFVKSSVAGSGLQDLTQGEGFRTAAEGLARWEVQRNLQLPPPPRPSAALSVAPRDCARGSSLVKYSGARKEQIPPGAVKGFLLLCDCGIWAGRLCTGVAPVSTEVDSPTVAG